MDREYAAFYHVTGEIIRDWAELETAFQWHLTTLLGTTSFRARVIWDSLPNFRARHQLISRLAETFADESFLPAYRRFLKRMKIAVKNRNTLAHSWGGVDEKPNHVVFLYDDDQKEAGYDFVSQQSIHMNSIRDWAKDVRALIGEVFRLNRELGAAVHTLPRTHRAQQRGHPQSRQGHHGQSSSGTGPTPHAHAGHERQPQSWHQSVPVVTYRWASWHQP